MSDEYGFVDRFSRLEIGELVSAFNNEVGNRGWTTARMHFLSALRSEFLAREIDCTSFISGDSMSVKNQIRLENGRLLVITNDQEVSHQKICRQGVLS